MGCIAREQFWAWACRTSVHVAQQEDGGCLAYAAGGGRTKALHAPGSRLLELRATPDTPHIAHRLDPERCCLCAACRKLPKKLEFMKYDPRVRKHVLFSETKLK